ncbi:MAG TPA: hypothetical protein VJ023_07650 [Pyrinomonadaceae bacterium]|nr:hypothetical protein [Pyrinomonadaceae bacterium]
MKKLGLGLGVALLLIWPVTADLVIAPDRTAAQQAEKTPEQTTLEQIEAQDPLQDNYERKRADFRSGHELLIRKGVPFDPDILLEDDWRERVKPFLGQMAQMSQLRRMSNKLNGAQLADILYLPEKIELTGDTIILTRRLVFEGRNILIKGPHNIYVFIIEPEAISTLSQESLTRKRNLRFANARFTEPVVPQSNEDLSITIDVSGFGHKEWLEQQAAARKRGGVQLVRAGYRAHSLPQTPANGSAGSAGNDGPDATVALQADPLQGSIGSEGVCGTTGTVNGGTGQPGGDGGNGGDGNTGLAGGNGGPGGTIYFTTGATGTYTFEARGGNGGPGGRGSVGALGAPGGTGGRGGNGKDCPCNQGGAGSGGTGGSAGFGGHGGNAANGGDGGFNGAGGDVHVTIPYGSSPTLIFLNGGGTGGQGGISLGAGSGGAAGNPGGGGSGVTGTFGCGNGNAGGSGAVATNGQPGTSASSGLSRPNGASGHNFVCMTAPPGGAPCPGGTWLCTGWQCYSPIIIDTDGNGFDLTDGPGGVNFDFFGNGQAIPLSWTTSSADDSWLTLDRNGNGMVESGRELFGNLTPQPASDRPNGFLALAVYDQSEEGGNGDAVLDSHDAIFQSLRLWKDTNHNGISEFWELHTLPDFDVKSISLEYKESRRTDQYGNTFRYRAKVLGARSSSVGRWAYDVFLLRAP